MNKTNPYCPHIYMCTCRSYAGIMDAILKSIKVVPIDKKDQEVADMFTKIIRSGMVDKDKK